MPTDTAHQLRPRRRTDFEEFPVAGELVLLPPSSDRVFALNESGAAIWRFCDGCHSINEMLEQLTEHFRGDPVRILADLSVALLELQSMGLVDTSAPGLSTSPTTTIGALGAERAGPDVHFVFGVEDQPYFHWQLAVLFESFVGQLPPGWKVVVVVCNGHREISAELRTIAEVYGVILLTGENLADIHDIDFADRGERYVALNRVEALAVAGAHMAPDDLLCLMDTDTFLYGDLQDHLFPSGNAMAKNWIISQERFFQFSTNDEWGVSLPKLLEAMGCSQEFKPGGVTVFLTGETVRNRKFIKDCFRFLQVVYLLGKIGEAPECGVWVSEMACFALALVPSGIEMELLETPQFMVPDPEPASVPEGTFFHYYTDINDRGQGPFFHSQWHKQLYRERSLLDEDLAGYVAAAQSPVERRFFELATRAQERLDGTAGS